MAMNISGAVSQQDRAKLESNEWRTKNQIPWNATEGDTRGQFQYRGGQWGYAGGGGGGGGGQSQGGGGGVQDPVDIAKRMFEAGEQFRKPALETLESGRGRIGEAYGGLRETAQAEKEPLNQRYQNMLKDITSGTEKAAASEFSKRGIPLSSGLVEQTVGSRLAPQIERVGLERESGLRDINQLIANLGMQESQQYGALDQAKSAIQSMASGEAIGAAQNIYGQQQTAATNQAQLALQQLQNQQAQQWKQKEYDYATSQPNYMTVGAGQNLIDPSTGKVIYSGPYKPEAGGGSGLTAEDFYQLFGQGIASAPGGNTITDKGYSVPGSFRAD